MEEKLKVVKTLKLILDTKDKTSCPKKFDIWKSIGLSIRIKKSLENQGEKQMKIKSNFRS